MQKVLPLVVLLNKISKKHETCFDTEVIRESLFPFLLILVPAETASAAQAVCARWVCVTAGAMRDMRPMRMTYKR
jgi:hypothetical protein